MKKTLIMLACLLVAVGGAFANGQRETITVEGKLAVKDTVPSIVANDKSWVLPAGPFYQIAWENGVKVGDSIKAEGVLLDDRGPGDSDTSGVFIPSKVWVNGKEISLSTLRKMGPRDGCPGIGERGMRGRGNNRMMNDEDDCPKYR